MPPFVYSKIDQPIPINVADNDRVLNSMALQVVLIQWNPGKRLSIQC